MTIPDDEGPINMGIAADHEHNVVRLAFPFPTTWVALEPERAVQVAGVIICKAVDIREAVHDDVKEIRLMFDDRILTIHLSRLPEPKTQQ